MLESVPGVLNQFREQTTTKLSFVDSAIVYIARQRADGLVLTFDDELRKVAGLHSPR